MNPIEMSLDSNDIKERLTKYKKFKYRFLIENILFSSNFENTINVIFVTCNSLSDEKALINSKIQDKISSALYLLDIENWNLIKGESKISQAIFVDSEYHMKSSRFGFAFTTKTYLIYSILWLSCQMVAITTLLFRGTKQKYQELDLKFKLLINGRKN